PTLPVEYSIESPDSEITFLRVLVDGRPVSVERGFKPTGKRLSASVSIPAANCVVSVIAENRFGASEPATIRVQWKGAAPAPASFVDMRPRLYVLAIGVSQYQHSDITNLGLAAKDARDFAAVILLQRNLLYQEVEFKLLTDTEATKDNILDGLDWLQHQTTSRDVAMLYFAGHGLDDNSGNFYYLPVGADPNALRRSCISQGDVQSTVASVPGKILVFMDACHSGSLMRDINRRSLPPDVTSVINELISAENGAVVFSSATTRQYALENPAWGNGAFTKALVEGLSGQAKTPGQDKITVKTLDAYVAERVKKLTEGKQSPVTVYPPNVPDFPLALVR
ncbi:MAG: caspase family protein, partial [Saprospiraceae bacterium]|nr:caspase family protein [Saprospiraceae bacterium]